MDNLPESHDQTLDNQLADYTDRILSGELDAKAPEGIQPAELARLKNNILRLKTSAHMAKPSAATSARVRNQVLKEWKKSRQSENFFTRLLRSFLARPASRMAVVGVLTMLFILGLATTLIPSDGALAGTATNLQAWAPVFILAGCLLIALIFWRDGRS